MKSRIITLVLFISISQIAHGAIWETDDALILDDKPQDELSESTQVPDVDPPNSCITSDGAVGRCLTLSECYPYLYPNGTTDKDSYHFDFSLRDSLANFSEPCAAYDGTTLPSEGIGSGSIRDERICCASLSRAIAQGIKFPSYPRDNFILEIPDESPMKTAVSPDAKSGCSNGYSGPSLINKVVGGRPAKKGEFPYMVALFMNGRHHCGGSLIDSKTVLTAAHCVNNIVTASQLGKLKLYFGAHDLNQREGEGAQRSVKKLIFHKRFNMNHFQNDIALLKIKDPVPLNQAIQPVCLHSGSPPYDRGLSDADVAGWGKTSAHGPASSVLRTVNMRVWSNSACSQRYKRHQNPNHLTPQIVPGMVCAGGPDAKNPSAAKDSCQGDSGGPLTISSGGSITQFGIVSWGIGCGEYPGVYTRVDQFRSWISKYQSKL